jgi:hypothetical protein
MSDVTVRRTIQDGWIIYAIEEGLERVRFLPGFKNRVFRVPEEVVSDVDDPRTTPAAVRRLGGRTWNDDLSWDVVDEDGRLIEKIEPQKVTDAEDIWAELKQDTDPPVCTECGLHVGGESYAKLPPVLTENGKHVLGYRHRDCPPQKR